MASISKKSVVRRVNSLKFEEVLLCLRSKQRNALNGKKIKRIENGAVGVLDSR